VIRDSRLLSNNKNPSSIVDIFNDRKKMYSNALSMAQEILREESYLTPLDREIIATYTSKLNNCDFCYKSHLEFTKSLTNNFDNEFTIESYSNKYHSIFKLAEKITQNPPSVTDDDIQTCYSDGWTKDEVKDAIAVICIFNFYNRIVESYGVQGYSTFESSVDRINKHGYDGRY